MNMASGVRIIRDGLARTHAYPRGTEFPEIVVNHEVAMPPDDSRFSTRGIWGVEIRTVMSRRMDI